MTSDREVPFKPGKLWSLWDMYKLRIQPLTDLLDLLGQLVFLLQLDEHRERVSDPKQNVDFPKYLRRAIEDMDTPELSMCKVAAERLLNQFNDGFEIPQLLSSVQDVRSRILDQVTLIHCYGMSDADQALYEPTEPLFGLDVRDKFTDAAFDIDESAKCLALGRSTAAVFHLMRVMEIMLKATSRCLGIPDPMRPAERNWAFILKKIRDGIDAKWPTSLVRSQADGALFEDLYVSLDAVRNPWRNATMHVEKTYTLEEARHVYDAVKAFAKKVASRMDQDGEPLA